MTPPMLIYRATSANVTVGWRTASGKTKNICSCLKDDSQVVRLRSGSAPQRHQVSNLMAQVPVLRKIRLIFLLYCELTKFVQQTVLRILSFLRKSLNRFGNWKAFELECYQMLLSHAAWAKQNWLLRLIISKLCLTVKRLSWYLRTCCCLGYWHIRINVRKVAFSMYQDKLFNRIQCITDWLAWQFWNIEIRWGLLTQQSIAELHRSSTEQFH